MLDPKTVQIYDNLDEIDTAHNILQDSLVTTKTIQ